MAGMEIVALLADPSPWPALLTLVILEVVLGIDNLVFIAILSNRLPAEQQQLARRIGLALGRAPSTPPLPRSSRWTWGSRSSRS
jgi:predicted tellurium resistance membrane protein TerC